MIIFLSLGLLLFFSSLFVCFFLNKLIYLCISIYMVRTVRNFSFIIKIYQHLQQVYLESIYIENGQTVLVQAIYRLQLKEMANQRDHNAKL